MNDNVDQPARDAALAADNKAQRALDDIKGHEDLCAERYSNINVTLKRIVSILGWAGTTIFGLLMVTLGWLIVQQIGRNESDQTLLKAQIELLQQQMRPVTGSTAY